MSDKTEKPDKATTAADLLDRLKESGTGPAKLTAVAELVRRVPNATAEDAFHKLVESGAPEATLAKAEDFIGVRVARQSGGERPYPVRAPEGGCKIAGFEYQPGQVIPALSLVQASPEEIETLHRLDREDEAAKAPKAKGRVESAEVDTLGRPVEGMPAHQGMPAHHSHDHPAGKDPHAPGESGRLPAEPDDEETRKSARSFPPAKHGDTSVKSPPSVRGTLPQDKDKK